MSQMEERHADTRRRMGEEIATLRAENEALRGRLVAVEAGIAAEIARHGTGIRTGLEIAARIVRES